MRIVLFARFFFSGQSVHVVELARELSRQGQTVAVVFHGRGHPRAWQAYEAILAEEKITTAATDNDKDAICFLNRFAPHILHVHSSDLIDVAMRIRPFREIPVIVTCHGLGVAQKSRALAGADRIIAVGNNVAADLMRAGITAVSVIPNGVDTDRFHPEGKPNPGPWKFAYVGRIDAAKRFGFDQLIDAVHRIPAIRLTVAANDMPVHPRVVSLGWVTDTAPLLKASHGVIGTGRAIREGLAAGCVAFVLGRRYGGMVVPSRIDRDATNIDFSGMSGDEPRAHTIRHSFHRLIQDKSLFHRLSLWGRNLSESHMSLRFAAEKTVALYRQLFSKDRLSS